MSERSLRCFLGAGAVSRVASLLIMLFVFSGCRDRIHVRGLDAEESGLLIDGHRGAGHWQNHVSISSDVHSFPNLIGFRETDEVVGFARRRAVHSVPARWTLGSDILTLQMPAEYRVPVVAWIVAKSNGLESPTEVPSAHILKVRLHVDTANAIFEKERMGIRLVLDNLGVRLPNHPDDLDDLYDFDKSEESELIERVGKVTCHLNIYYVDKVKAGSEPSSTSGGIWTGSSEGNVIALGSNVRPHLLAHEVGHALALYDVDTEFGAANVMDPYPPDGERRWLTEGQIYRAHYRKGSYVRRLELRDPSDPYFTDASEAGKPTLDLRIWPDEKPSRIQRIALERWLALDCVTEEPLELIDAMRREMESSLPGLEDALAAGPPRSSAPDHVDDYYDHERAYRERAANGLLALHTAAARSLLEKLAGHADPAVAESARNALGRWNESGPSTPAD